MGVFVSLCKFAVLSFLYFSVLSTYTSRPEAYLPPKKLKHKIVIKAWAELSEQFIAIKTLAATKV